MIVATRQSRRRAGRLEPAAHDWRGAVVSVRWNNAPDGPPMERFAIFVFDRRRGGAVWVEGGYADPLGTPGPAMHEIVRLREVAPRVSAGPAFEGEGGNGAWTATIEPYMAGASPEFDRALRRFDTEYLPQSGRTWAEEREWVRGVVLSDE